MTTTESRSKAWKWKSETDECSRSALVSVGWFPGGGSYYITRGNNPRCPICDKTCSLLDDKWSKSPIEVSFEKVLLCILLYSAPSQGPEQIANKRSKEASHQISYLIKLVVRVRGHEFYLDTARYNPKSVTLVTRSSQSVI